MINFLETSWNTVSNGQFLLITILLSVSCKLYFLGILIPQGLRASKIQKPWFYLLGILAGSLFGDIAWIVKLIREMWLPSIDYSTITFFIRIAWGFLILQYQSLALFIESLTEKNFTLSRIHKFLILVGGSFSLYFFYIAFFDGSLSNEFERERAKVGTLIPLEISLMRYASYYLFNLLLVPSLFTAFKKLRTAKLPNILKKQLRIFIQFLIVPYILIELLQAAHFLFSSFEAYLYPTVSISTVLLIYAIYYCIQQVMGLRFLDFNSHVQTSNSPNFIDDFKTVFEQLNYSTTTQELSHIIQTFFKDAFGIPLRKTTVYLRAGANTATPPKQLLAAHKIENSIELFLNNHTVDVCSYINVHKILIYDEIDFSNFYDEDPVKKTILEFLESIGADIFLPIYEKQKIIAYVIVDRHAREQEFYSIIERDEMLVFASYLSNVLNLLNNRNVQTLLDEEKELRATLYRNQQEISQYKESIRSLLKNANKKEIGIIFYKNRRFFFGNQAAKELINININTQEGHPLTQALRRIARQVEEYKTPQTTYAKDTAGNRLAISGVPNLEHNNVIISVYYPEFSEIITKQIVLLKDPNQWEYLLYLESTQAGHLISQLIPGSTEQLLHFKISLLHIALSNSSVLLEFSEDDVSPFVDLLHHMSKRETLHTLALTHKEKNYETAIKLLGASLATGAHNASSSLLKKLDKTGTVHIKNVELLDLETQEYIAEYMRSGMYRIFKSEQRIASSVRIICSTQANLSGLVQEGAFSKNLYEQLNKATLTFPSLITISESELFELIDGFTEQIIKTNAFKNLLELTDAEKTKLIAKRPASLQELKTRIHQLLITKSKKNQIYDQSEFDPAYNSIDPELVNAARLGKHALRDAHIMGLLWNKFQNQNQIATFLGVNRSSVNRRCKDYNLG
jgi:transcriptional regulator of aromatic amino acid metabolism